MRSNNHREQPRSLYQKGKTMPSKPKTEQRHFAATGEQVILAGGKTVDGQLVWYGYTKADFNHTTPLDIVRTITYRTHKPSLHICDGRCYNAAGSSCECQCGGKNHGAGNHTAPMQ